MGVHDEYPNNIEAEQSVLGGILLNPTCLPQVIDILGASETIDGHTDLFYSGAHTAIWSAMLALWGKDGAVDGVTLMNLLRATDRYDDAGGVVYLSDLLGAVPTSANIEEWAEIVRKHAVARAMMRHFEFWTTKARKVPDDMDGWFAEMDTALRELTFSNHDTAVTDYFDAMDAVHAEAEAVVRGEVSDSTPTGYPILDVKLGGWRREDLVVIAGRPAMGKSAIALNIAANAAQHGENVLFFSLEMATNLVAKRLIAIQSNSDIGSMFTKFSNPHTLRTRIDINKQRTHGKIKIIRKEAASPAFIRAMIAKQAQKLTPRIVIVDYMQLVETPNMPRASRQEQVAFISRTLKRIAIETGTTVIALAQLNRSAEGSDPNLAHFRESGAIEQDADIAIMLAGERTGVATQPIELKIAKNRNGEVGKVMFEFDKKTQRFIEMDGRSATNQPPATTPPPVEPARSYTPMEAPFQDFEEELF